MMKKTLLLIALTAMAATRASAQMLVITEVYGAGGNSGATGQSDYIELYNPSTTALDLSTYSLQYASSTGNFVKNASQFTILSGTLQPQDYFLIQLATTTTNGGAALPTPDFTFTALNIATANGKIAISNQTAAAITGSADASVVDFVGYGTANDFSGTAKAPAPSATMSISRGTLTAPKNNSDFTAGTLSPTNSTFNPNGGSTGVPEPSSYATMALGGLGVFAMLRFRRRRA